MLFSKPRILESGLLPVRMVAVGAGIGAKEGGGGGVGGVREEGWGGAAEVDREEASGREGAGCRAATTAATPPCYYGGHARVQRLSGEWQTEQQQANPIPIPIPNLNPNPNTLTATSTAIDSPPKARANSAR